MTENSKLDINQPTEDDNTCCNNADCCGSQTPMKRTTPKIGRNDPCPCDSGRKFKKCCGQAL